MKKLFFLLLVVISIIGCDSDSVDLRASFVKGTNRIVIENKDIFGYDDVVIKLNEKYRYKCKSMYSGEKLMLSPYDFVNKDGVRFNVLNVKIMNISLSCKVYDESYEKYKFGFAYGEF